jgi:8-oxo-dGTP pyrophosphatase MutT (NUDIX family)
MRDIRDPLLKLLSSYPPFDDADQAQATRIKEFVLANADCFERSNLKGHITGSAWMVNSAGTHILLTHHKKLNLWLQLGGHSDGDQNPLQVALREAQEESGLTDLIPVSEDIFDVDVHPIPANKNEPAHDHHDIRFALRCTADQPLRMSDESQDLRWVAIAELEKFKREESILRMKKKWLARIKNPPRGEN